MSDLLDENVLTEYVGVLRSNGILAADHLLSGLSSAEIDTIAADAGIKLPAEARAWWRFCNGTSDDAPDESREIGPEQEWCSLEWAIAERDRIIENLAPHFPAEDILWRPTWLPFLGTHRLALDISGPEVAVVRPVDFHVEREAQGAPIASLRSLVEVWIAGHNADVLVYEPDDGTFELDFETLDDLGLPEAAF